MRKLLFAMSALAALFMIVPSSGYAQFDYQSMVGLYYDDTVLDDHTGTTVGFVTEDLHLVLTNPYLNVGLGEGESGTVPVTAVKAFDFRVTAPAGHTLLGLTLPVPGTVLGEMPDFAAGLSSPVVVSAGSVTLGYVSVFVASTDHAEYFLSPVAESPEIPGFMAAVDSEGTSFKMFPVSDSYDAPVFVFNPTSEITSAESESWGNVKALYR